MNHFAAWVRSFAALLLITALEKLVFAGFHIELLTDQSPEAVAAALVQGLRFDAALTAVLALLAWLPAWLLTRPFGTNILHLLRPLTMLAAAALVFLHGADLLYFGETGRHLGYELLEAVNSGAELAAVALSGYTVPVLLQLALLPPALWLVHRLLPRRPRESRLFGPARRPWWQRLQPEAELVLVGLLTTVLLRGGLQSVPLEPLHAQAVGDPHRAALALNGAYNALFSSLTSYAVKPVLAPPDEKQWILARALLEIPPSDPRPAQRPNIVLLFLESWAAPYMASYGYDQETTPFFDSWRSRTLTTRDMLAGGHRTTEGLFATLCSAQNPLGATVAQTQLQHYAYRCLPHLLHEQGYASAFFQGTVSGTSGTGAFTQLLGFEHSYGKEHVENLRLPLNIWGLHDPDLYDFALEKMAGLKAPFLVGINTNSTHGPELPPGTETPFPPDPTAGNYVNVLRYADGALGEFVAELRRRFPDTIIVAVSDHAEHGGPGRATTADHYRIAFLLDAPGLAPAYLPVTASQRDIAPTLLDLLGMAPAPQFSGRSLLNAQHGPADYYHAGTLGWTEGDRSVEFALTDPTTLRCLDAASAFAPRPCEAEDQARRERALAFTSVMQHLLFTGRLASRNELPATQP